jgi:hypothetical protein
VVAALAGDRAADDRRDQGPPAAGTCATNRALLVTAQHRRQPAPFIPGAATGTAAALVRTAADWSAATCCPRPDRDVKRPAEP